jgi:hypothetical protein
MYIIENDIRNLLLQRDVDILLEVASDEDGQDFLTQRVLFAIDFVKSKFQHRYDPDQIFIDVNIFDINTSYAIDDLIYYEETAYDNTAAYVVGNRISYLNYIYECVLDSTGNLPTNATYWTQKVRNKQYFKNIVAGASVYPEVTTSWTLGDTRHQLVLTYTVTIASYELFKKVQPNMIPNWLISSRDEAVTHLDRIARGLDTVLLPLYLDEDGEPDDTKGQEISYGNKYETQDYDF